MKKSVKRIAVCFMCALLAAISITEMCPVQTVMAAPKETAKKVKKAKKKKVLIVYYSQSGTTKKVAEKIKKMTGGTIYRIQTKKKYPSDYDELVDNGERELEEGARPALKKKLKSIKQYDTIILGYPIWLAYHNLIQCAQA